MINKTSLEYAYRSEASFSLIHINNKSLTNLIESIKNRHSSEDEWDNFSQTVSIYNFILIEFTGK